MGSTFTYIADESLAPCGGEQCHHCQCTDQPIYSYRGRIVDPRLAKDPQLALEEPDISELCAVCIVGNNVRKHDHAIREILPTIETYAADKNRTIGEYHRTPDLCLFQGRSWPICCGDMGEYVGTEPASGSIYEDYEPWQPQDHIVARFKLRDFYPLDKLRAMNTMALFRCVHCEKKYWVFQYSGMLWPGPLAGG